jgi:hypothetical protein
LDIAQFGVYDAEIDAARLKEGLRLGEIGALNKAVLVSLQCLSNGFSEIWMRPQN